MSYVRKDLDITPVVYQQMESLRKSYLHEDLNKEQALELLDAMGLPMSNKLWELYLKYSILKKLGTTRYTHYVVSPDQYSMHTLQHLEEEYYGANYKKRKSNPNKEDKELGRTKLTPKFARDYLDKCDDPLLVDFCIEQLKKRGNFLVFEVTPRIHKLKAVSLEYLIECSEAELKLQLSKGRRQ